MTDVVYGDIRDRLNALPHLPDGTWYRNDDLFTVRYELIKEWAPRSVLEIGTLVGYFLVTAYHASPFLTRVGWVDNESHMGGSNRLVYENLRATRATWPGRHQLVCWHAYQREQLEHCPWPHFDLIGIDGDHSTEGCLADLEAAHRFRPNWMMIDDWSAESHGADIQAAVRGFLDDHPVYELTEFVTVNGLAVLTRRP